MKSVRPKKFLGQHFLKDLPTAQAIADTVDAAPGLPILEVGPGMGVLTQYLLKKGREPKVVTKHFESLYEGDKEVEVELFTWEKLDYVDQVKEAFGLK